MFVVLVSNIIYVPIQLSFDIKMSEIGTVFLDTIPNLAFAMEIVLNFNTAVYIKGFLIQTRQEIIHYYLRKRFLYYI